MNTEKENEGMDALNETPEAIDADQAPEQEKDGEKRMGEVQVAQGVYEHIAYRETCKVAGIVGFGSESGLVDWMKKGSGSKGVRVRLDEQALILDISISVEYGHPIKELARDLQERIVTAIETMTGRRPDQVNVHLASLVDPRPPTPGPKPLPAPEPPPEAPEEGSSKDS